MVKDAEKYEDDDVITRERIEAKNALEGYLYNLKLSIEDSKMEQDDKDEVKVLVDDTLKWMEENDTAETDVLVAKLEECTAITDPMMQKMST